MCIRDSPSPLLDITTTATGLRGWRDSHPLEWQLASLHGHSRPMHSALIPANVRCYSNSDLTLAQLNCPLSANNRLVRAGYNYVETSYLDMQYGCSASGWQSPG